jgi:hypothetical protein
MPTCFARGRVEPQVHLRECRCVRATNCPMQKCYSYRGAAAHEERERYQLQSELMRQHAVECQRDTLSACTSQAGFD